MEVSSQPSDAAPEGALPYLPIFMDLQGRVCLLIGDGELASVKLALLRRAGARVRLVATNPQPILAPALADPMVMCADGPLRREHFEDAAIAIDASGCEATNAVSAALAKAAGVPINVADRTHLCDFILPAILDRSPIVVAISTGGLAPAIARLIRQRLERAIPPGFARIVELAARLRHAVSERSRPGFGPPSGTASSKVPRRAGARGCADKAAAAAEHLIEELASDRRRSVFLVGAGPGNRIS